MATPEALCAGLPVRPSLPAQGLAAAGVGGLLAVAGLLGIGALTVAVAVLQVLLVLGGLALLAAPGARGLGVLGGLAAAAADAVVLSAPDELGGEVGGDVDGLAGVVGLALVASLLLQLLRRERVRVTESLAGGLFVIVLGVCAACLLALRQSPAGADVLFVGLAAAATSLLAGRLADRAAPRPALRPGSTRGWPGLLLGLGSGALAGLAVAAATGIPGLRGGLLGLAASATVAAADLAADLAATGLRGARLAAAVHPVARLLPYAVLGPVVLVVGRLVLV